MIVSRSHLWEGCSAPQLIGILGIEYTTSSQCVTTCGYPASAIVPEEVRDIALTPNEYDIIKRLLRSETASEIASATGRSVHTVRTTIRVIYDKIGLRGVAQVADALACGVIRLHPGHQHKEPKRPFDLTSALRVLEREHARTAKGIRTVRLHPDEISMLLHAGRAYSLFGTIENDFSSLVDRVERLVIVSESERSTIAGAIAALLGVQDATNGPARCASQVDALGTLCSDTPFALRGAARKTLLETFRTSYATGYRTARSPKID